MRNLIALFLTAGCLTATFAAAPAVPRKAAEFVIKTPEGKQPLLSSYKGKTVVLALMFTTCSHCQKTAGVLSTIQKEYAARGVQILGATIDADAPKNIRNFNQYFATGFPCGVSTDRAAREFLQLSPTDPYFVPILVFIDKTGTVRSQYIGDETFLNNQEVNIRAEINKLLK